MHEALANVQKHACATNVRVALAGDGGGLQVTVEDDGVGFVPPNCDAASNGFGLRIMAERAAEVGATLSISSEPGCGTRVTVRLPGPQELEAAEPVEQEVLPSLAQKAGAG